MNVQNHQVATMMWEHLEGVEHAKKAVQMQLVTEEQVDVGLVGKTDHFTLESQAAVVKEQDHVKQLPTAGTTWVPPCNQGQCLSSESEKAHHQTHEHEDMSPTAVMTGPELQVTNSSEVEAKPADKNDQVTNYDPTWKKELNELHTKFDNLLCKRDAILQMLQNSKS